MATYAIIENNKVTNVIIADQNFIETQDFIAVLVNEDTGVPYHEATWNGTTFIPPQREETLAADVENRIPAPNFGEA